MGRNRIHTAVETVHAGGMTFEAFVLATRQEWKRLARYLLTHWQVPSAVEAEDIEQECLIAAWRALNDWHEGGADIGTHVVWNAISAAKKWIHVQRNALRRSERNPSRHEVSISQLLPKRGTEDRSSVLEPTIDPVQSDRIESAERLRDVLGRLEQRDGVCVVAFVSTGSIEGAAREIGADLRMRLALRIGSDDDARRLIRSAVTRAAQIEA